MVSKLSGDLLPCNGTAGHLLALIRRGYATTRAELAEATGLARSTIALRLDQLREAGLIRDAGDAPSTGGRPSVQLGLNADAGVVLVADLGATHSRVEVSDLAGRPLAEQAMDMPIADGAETVLHEVERMFEDLLVAADRDHSAVRGIGIGVPGPVEFAAGRTINPPIMPGWHGYPIRDRFIEAYGAPTLVDNDVNIMALGEHWATHPNVDDLLFVKIGTGIGSGLILGGRLHRGAQGAAGDIGHIPAGPESMPCRCGNLGCLEASAGGGALAARLEKAGYQTQNSRDVVALVQAGNREAVQAVREAGRLIGGVLASTVNLLNPSVIVIGGDMARAGEHLLAGIREFVYRRSTALSTGHLQILTSRLGERAGIVGAAAMAIEHVLAPTMVDQLVSTPQ